MEEQALKEYRHKLCVFQSALSKPQQLFSRSLQRKRKGRRKATVILIFKKVKRKDTMKSYRAVPLDTASREDVGTNCM